MYRSKQVVAVKEIIDSLRIIYNGINNVRKDEDYKYHVICHICNTIWIDKEEYTYKARIKMNHFLCNYHNFQFMLFAL